jgi:two-component system cell cycle sensor histidine kinase/response regulator CckA
VPRILIVDDNDDNVYYLDTLLKAHGYAVDVARHGMEAIHKARQATPDVVVSDLLMPVMDGYTLLRRWKADAALRTIPFVVFTATYTDASDEQLARDLGADAFMLKPAEPTEIIGVLTAALRDRPRQPTMTDPSGEPVEGDLLREYSEALVRKLEEKSLQLEETNRALKIDIEARIAAVAAAKESGERFRQIAENIDDAFVLGDLGLGSILYVNPAFEHIWGIDKEALAEDPRGWREAVHSADRRRFDAALAASPIGGVDETLRIVRKRDGERWVRVRTYGVPDDDGTIYRLVILIRDVTEMRRLEDQFRHSQKMEAVGRIAGGVAHDFNNLLSVILSYASLVIEQVDVGDPVRDDVEEIRLAGVRAAALTGQLLAFSRKQVLNPRVIDLGEVVLAMKPMLARVIGESVALSFSVNVPHVKVFADPTQIEQIVMNLVVNARDAMPAGGAIAIEIGAAELSPSSFTTDPCVEPGRYARLSVTDTGVGIDAETRARIFEPFFTTKVPGKGTGLGLSTVFGIVAQSRGHVEVTSEPGRGSTFVVSLPATDLEPAVAEPPAPAPTSLRGTETILLVEDDDQVRDVVRNILRRNGYVVVDAMNAGEALIMSEGTPSHIHRLLTDVVMPRMSGRELAARLLAKRSDMKVIYMSGYAEDAILEHGVIEDGFAYLQKPFTPSVLLHELRRVLDAR